MIVRKILLLILPLLLLVGFAAPSAQARDYHRGREVRHAYRGNYRQSYRHGYYGGRGYRHGYYGGHRRGYWRSYHGRRYWYQGGSYYDGPGGVIIDIGL